MAEAPFKIIDKRRLYVGGPNQLFASATQTTKRRRMPRLDQDYSRNVTELGWREMLSAARYICGRFGPVLGAIRQMAHYAIGNAFNAQYYGANRDWGIRMEAALEEWDKVCDVRGANVDFRTGLVLDLISIIRDGDTLGLLTQSDNGWPMVQSIPAHRIGVSGYTPGVDLGNGLTLVNGCIVNDYGRAVAFRVYSDAWDGSAYRELSATDAAMHFIPDYHEQVRGVTRLAPVIEDVADLYDIRSFLKTALKAESSIALVEENEMGGPPPMSGGGQFVAEETTNYTDPANTSVTETGAIFTETFDEGTVRYLRSGTGGKLSAVNSNRPGADSAKFYFEILRGSFEALGWPIEFYDPTALGGANIRMRVAQAKRTIEQLQMLAERIAIRKHRYAIAKLIKLGVLEPDVDWWKITHQKPRDLTVDNGRDTKADLDLYLKGAISLEELCGRMGNYWEDVQDQKIKEEKRLQERCAEEGVDPNRIQILTPSGMPAGDQQGNQNDGQQQDQNAQ